MKCHHIQDISYYPKHDSAKSYALSNNATLDIIRMVIWQRLMGSVLSIFKRKPKPIISIIGTTGVGKSDLGVYLAETFNGEIINADSMQMYKGLPEITNKQPINERHGIVHHVINHVNWDEEYHIHRFQKECFKAIKRIHKKGKIPILVGGTHYYLQSVLFLNKTVDSGDSPDKFKKKLLTEDQKKILSTSSPEQLHNLLVKYDPVVAMKFHPHDVRRIKRALEIYYRTGKTANQIYLDQQKQQKFHSRLRYNTLFLWVYSKKDVLEPRLDKRVDKMMNSGALRELTELYDYYCSLPEPKPKMDQGCFQVIGFKEFMPYLTSNRKHVLLDTSQEDVLKDELFVKCCNQMKLRTKQYAKKQVKWIKNTLIPDLSSEAEHNWCHFGKIYVVDATDLSLWSKNVKQRAQAIVEQFLKNKKVKESVPQIPESLADANLIREKKEAFDRSKWVYHTCDHCLDKDGKPLVFVGDQYQIHLKSKKHRRAINKGKRKREYEAWLNNKEVASDQNKIENSTKDT